MLRRRPGENVDRFVDLADLRRAPDGRRETLLVEVCPPLDAVRTPRNRRLAESRSRRDGSRAR